MLSASPSPRGARESYELDRNAHRGPSPTYPLRPRRRRRFAKQLKSQGYRFRRPTSVYAFMQNVGVLNDHVHGCFRATDYVATTRR